MGKDFTDDIEQDTADAFFTAPAQPIKVKRNNAPQKAKGKLPGEEKPAEEKPQPAAPAPKPKRLLPEKELKSVRKHISIQPSTNKGLEKLARLNRCSYNEVVNALLKEGLEKWGN